jgi:hypothetical protein
VKGTPPRVLNATFAVGNAVFETARIPLRAAEHLPGIGYLSFEGAAVKARLRSRLEGLLDDLLAAPEIERAIDQVVTRSLARRETPAGEAAASTAPMPR